MSRPNAVQARYDFAAIGASGLCVVHCVVPPVLLLTLPALAAWLAVPESFHLVMLVIAVPTSLMALYLGQRRHHNWTPILMAIPAPAALVMAALLFAGMKLETLLTVAGAAALIIAHLLNRRYARAILR